MQQAVNCQCTSHARTPDGGVCISWPTRAPCLPCLPHLRQQLAVGVPHTRLDLRHVAAEDDMQQRLRALQSKDVSAPPARQQTCTRARQRTCTGTRTAWR